MERKSQNGDFGDFLGRWAVVGVGVDGDGDMGMGVSVMVDVDVMVDWDGG